MTDFNFLSPEGFARIKAMHRLQTVLNREGQGYLRALHARCGVGLTVEQFDNIVKQLEFNGYCTLKLGAQGATLVILNPEEEASGPDEVVVESVQ